MILINEFQTFIWDFYHNNGREFAWRNVENSYYILVSEIMLQQTQTHRVIDKFQQFIDAFPTIESLAKSQLRDVLSVWQGLGYYRRAAYLYRTAQIIVEKYNGIIPDDESVLRSFPGIGVATASSICAFAYNMPTVFIETNIRTVFIHTFFKGQLAVTDKDLIPLISSTVDKNNPREWYYALMDYGVFLKSNYTNPSRKSVHYTKQSKFEGSDRQIRAALLKLIVDHGFIDYDKIVYIIQKDKNRINKILHDLEKEGFIGQNNDGLYYIL